MRKELAKQNLTKTELLIKKTNGGWTRLEHGNDLKSYEKMLKKISDSPTATYNIDGLDLKFREAEVIIKGKIASLISSKV